MLIYTSTNKNKHHQINILDILNSVCSDLYCQYTLKSHLRKKKWLFYCTILEFLTILNVSNLCKINLKIYFLENHYFLVLFCITFYTLVIFFKIKIFFFKSKYFQIYFRILSKSKEWFEWLKIKQSSSSRACWK